MEKITRRTLMKQVSLSAGAVGLLVTTAACDTPTSKSSTTTSANPANTSTDPLAIFVTDPARGTLVVMRGESEVTVTNLDLAQRLLAL